MIINQLDRYEVANLIRILNEQIPENFFSQKEGAVQGLSSAYFDVIVVRIV